MHPINLALLVVAIVLFVLVGLEQEVDDVNLLGFGLAFLGAASFPFATYIVRGDKNV